ncbi:8-oxo-dGDP phosphatase NUDT18 [Ornithorhynchus anatinus]|uniref:8-oxo-dGDP phosphatase NUDT18 n=1 Tax=Ornithorhynchus anatinus TaxID=9258 RepID=UPI0001555846|nr:8-oxo-dGDP phosphatase NUDT18 [Ornithorhynchus anatinus]
MASAGPAGALGAVLGGLGLEVRDCDSGPTEIPPVRIRRSVCYIVLAVFLNERDEVLMIQEAKRECHGSWYLPAGRMEPGETILEALKREVKEETGLDCQPLTLLAVEERGPRWIRFAFLARPTGGMLKTLDEADEESLQAGWYPRASLPSPLRAQDILPLIELGARYLRRADHPATLPQELPCGGIFQRLVAVFASAQNVWVLVGTAGDPHLPVTACGTTPSEQRGGMALAVLRLLRECLVPSQVEVETLGVLGLQHLGKDQADGLCLNVLVAVTHRSSGAPRQPPGVQGDGFRWWQVEEEDLRRQLLQRLRDSSVVPIHS